MITLLIVWTWSANSRVPSEATVVVKWTPCAPGPPVPLQSSTKSWSMICSVCATSFVMNGPVPVPRRTSREDQPDPRIPVRDGNAIGGVTDTDTSGG